MKKIEFVGTLFTGEGEGKKFLEQPWVDAQIQEKLGFKAHSGTLNVRLSKDTTKLRELLVKKKTLEILPSPGYGRGLLFKAWIAETECGIVVPQVEKYPDNMLEVIAPFNLRERFQLRNGSQIRIVVAI